MPDGAYRPAQPRGVGPLAAADVRIHGARPRAYRAWLWVAVCIALIGAASGESFSTGSTSRFLGPLLRWLVGDVDEATVARLHWGLRRAAHVVEYGLLALLSYRALRMTIRTTLLRHALGVVLLVAAVAASDEAHQSRLASRKGSVADVALDLAGGLAGLALAGWLGQRPRFGRWFPPAAPRRPS